jgi:hypothetical protein
MLIWGFRWTSVVLGQLTFACSHCARSIVHTGLVQKGMFTLFFIPIFPVGKKYLIVCNLCGLRRQASGDLQEQLKQWQQTGQFPAPRTCGKCHLPAESYAKFCTACGSGVA